MELDLAEWMNAAGVNDDHVAAETDVTRATISRVRRHKMEPSVELARKLVRLSGGRITLNRLYRVCAGVEAA